MKRRTLKELKSLVHEAEMILSRHDGIHNLHGATIGIKGWLHNAKEFGIKTVDWENIDALMEKIRITDRTGQYPKTRRINYYGKTS